MVTSTSCMPSWRRPSRATRLRVSRGMPVSPPSARMMSSTFTSRSPRSWENGHLQDIPHFACWHIFDVDSDAWEGTGGVGRLGSLGRFGVRSRVLRRTPGKLSSGLLGFRTGGVGGWVGVRLASISLMVAARTSQVPGWNWISSGHSPVDPQHRVGRVPGGTAGQAEDALLHASPGRGGAGRVGELGESGEPGEVPEELFKFATLSLSGGRPKRAARSAAGARVPMIRSA